MPKVACIGQAGENLVRFATTIFDKHASAARGSGAVWGSKNIKAIAVRGTGTVELAMPEDFKQLAKEDRQFFLNDKVQRKIASVYGSHNRYDVLGTWQQVLRETSFRR